MDRARLNRIRNWQSSEFYARLVMRPLSILIMLVVADWKWLTPNLVTTGANVAKLTGAALIAIDHQAHAMSAAIWLQVGLLLDHLDGTIARYRGCGTTFGAFYDKASDAITWLVITGAIGWAAYKDTGDVWLPIGAVASAHVLLTIGYAKWIIAAASNVTRRAAVATPPMAPPHRTGKEWAVWFASSIARIVMFEEVDLFFWIGLGLLIGRLEPLIALLVLSQAVQLVIMIVKRGLQARRLDLDKLEAAQLRAA